MFDTLQSIFGSVGAGSPGNSKYISFAAMAGAVLNFMMAVAFAISILAVAYSAIMYIVSGGNPDNTKKAWNAFIYGVVGAAVSVGLFALTRIVLSGFGVEGVRTDINQIIPGF